MNGIHEVSGSIPLGSTTKKPAKSGHLLALRRSCIIREIFLRTPVVRHKATKVAILVLVTSCHRGANQTSTEA